MVGKGVLKDPKRLEKKIQFFLNIQGVALAGHENCVSRVI
jgi:hypothetical protein